MKRALVDLSSVIWTCLLASKDKEFGKKVMFEDKEVLINSARYGFDNAMNHILKMMDDLHVVPTQLIFVMEGMDSKHDRQVMHPGYKAGRSKAPEQYEQFNLCKEMLIKAFLDVGSQVCWQDGGVEADDVLGYLAQNLQGERWIVSGDKDLAQAVGGDVHHYRAGKIDENPFGDFPHRFIPVYISLVGDATDKIPGAKGFGEKAAQLMLLAFGADGLEMMEGLILNKELLRLEEDVGVLRELQRVIDDPEGVYMSYELGRLRTERVNTMGRPLQWRVGMVKPREQCVEQPLRKHSGVKRIVSAENYDEAVAWAKKQIAISPCVSLDIETSTPQESDDWLESRDKADRVDVFGSELTSLQMTFGPNNQYTFYLPHDNVEEQGCTNLTVKQIADFVDLVPRTLISYIQNVAFELPILYMTWGEMWAADPLYHGFLRNVRDTKIMSSYVDENFPAGLKDNSKRLLGYDQVDYATVTTTTVRKDEWDGVGKVIQTLDDDGVEGLVVQRKMNQLTAAEVLNYGCDDTICTIALANHFRTVMELEATVDVWEQVETYPAYLTALAYVQGTAFSLESMAEQEKDDDAAYAAAEPVLLDYLIKIGFEGTRFEPLTVLDAAGIKRACLEVTGQELKTQVRTPSKLAKLIEMQSPDSVLPQLIDEGALTTINGIMEEKFTGNPNLDLASPKQMKVLLYDFMKIPVKVINDITVNERVKQPDLAEAVKKFKAIRAGRSALAMTDEEMALMRQKAKTDDTAIDFAIAFDTEVLDDEARAALKAIGVMKKVMTRRSLFYKNYWKGLHWKDGKMHSSMNQCAAVTRRYSSSDQNLTQLPKKGEGVRFRGHFKPHRPDAVIASIDFVGQELRLAAERSQDHNMLACYVGDKLKDIHSITAAGALKLKWGAGPVEELFAWHGPELPCDADGTYDLFIKLRELGKDDATGKKADDLRKDAKNVNFGAQNGAQAAKLSETLVMPFADAQLFLDARNAMFPGVGRAAEAAADFARRKGYALTFMGARRHLQEAMRSNEPGAADRAARQSWNFEIQGSAGEMTKLAMKRLWLRNVYFRYDARFIAPIHDELVSSVRADDAVEFLREKHDCMAHPYSTMKVPVLGSISIGPDFAHQTECGDWFIEERIRGALSDIFQLKEAA